MAPYAKKILAHTRTTKRREKYIKSSANIQIEKNRISILITNKENIIKHSKVEVDIGKIRSNAIDI